MFYTRTASLTPTAHLQIYIHIQMDPYRRFSTAGASLFRFDNSPSPDAGPETNAISHMQTHHLRSNM